MIRVGLFDDQELVRQGLCRLLDLVPDMRVTVQAGSVEEGRRAAVWDAVDIALVDVRFPDGTGMDLLSAWREACVIPAVLMLTTFPDDAAMLSCLQLGARGFLYKDIGLKELLNAIRFVHQGGVLTQPAVQRPTGATPQFKPDHFDLTEREAETLNLLRVGMSNRELAAAQQVTEGTIKNRISSILRKLGVRDRTAAVIKSLDQ